MLSIFPYEMYTIKYWKHIFNYKSNNLIIKEYNIVFVNYIFVCYTSLILIAYVFCLFQVCLNGTTSHLIKFYQVEMNVPIS